MTDKSPEPAPDSAEPVAAPAPGGTEPSLADLGGLAQLVAARRARLDALRNAGVDPYPARADRSHTAAEARREFEAAEAAGQAAPSVALAGRLVGSIRRMGGSAFVHLADASGQIQLYLRRDGLGGDEFERALGWFDPGDFVRVAGTTFRTRRGEITVDVANVAMLAKSLLPLPEKWHGLQDLETRFRKRYLDLISNAESRERFTKRTAIVREVRRFLDDRGFLEVETPVLQPVYGGGAAEPFVTDYQALAQRMYLRIADELYLKRLLVGGIERVYEIGKDFRNEGIDRTHLPEFTQMECYWAFADYRDMMALTEELIAHVAAAVNGSTDVLCDGQRVALAPPWQRMTVREAIRQHAAVDIEAHPSLAELRLAIRKADLAADEQPTWAKTVDELLSEHVEPHLVQPTFLVDYPEPLSPLAKRTPYDPRYVERFEAFANRLELGNSFSELNDPLEQRARFEAMQTARESGDTEAHPLDEDFLEALMHGMPPAGGLGIGIDRLVMLLTGQANIREVVLFPQLRNLP